MNAKIKIGVGLLTLVSAFVGGARIEHWRITSKYETAATKQEAAVRVALEAAATHVNEINQTTAAREQGLLLALSRGNQTAQELRNELDQRPIIRQVVTKTVVAPSGAVECPVVPTVDWGVFQAEFNRAARGTPEAGAAGGRDAGVLGVAAGDQGRP